MVASERDAAAQSLIWPGSCVPVSQSLAGAVRTNQVLTIVCGYQVRPETLRRATGSGK